MAMNGTITLVSNKDNGKITKPTVAKGTTVKEMLYAEFGGSVDPDKYQVVVDGKVVADLAACKLKDGSFVVISPINVKGN